MFFDTNPFKSRGIDFLSSTPLKTDEELSSIRYSTKVSLRREKRNEIILNKRRQQESSPQPIKSLDSVLSNLSTKSIESLKDLRKLSSRADFNYFELLRQCPNIISILTSVFSQSSEEFIYEVTWIFSNLALGPQCLVVEVSQIIPQLSQFILSGKKALAEQACWVLGNLAAESREIKNRIKSMPRLIPGLVNLLNLNDVSLASVTCWTLCNLVRGVSPDCREIIQAGVLAPALRILKKPFSNQVVECLWLLSFISNENEQQVLEQVYTEERLEIYKKYIDFDDDKIVLPVVRILGNGFLFECNMSCLFGNSFFVTRVLKILKVQEAAVRKETIWMVSNLFTRKYVEVVMGYAGDDVIKALVCALNDECEEVKAEAAIAIYNLCEVCNSDYFLSVLEFGKVSLIQSYLLNVHNVPTWVGFNLNSVFDINVLQASLAFICICMELSDLPYEFRECLLSEKVKDMVEDCKVSLSKAGTWTEDEITILRLCDYILSIFLQQGFH